jgi:aryl-alcohol dehydrogenase-like predicted oxidoreductase
MDLRPLGATGITVSVVGLGAGPLGSASLSESDADALLNGALDHGVVLIDTARSYGLSEERIGRHLAKRRDEFVISTKGGYGVDGVADWTGEAITLGINRALRTLRTDRLDVFHLHSCPRAVLEDERILAALESALTEGKIRAAAYSGEGEALGWAIGSGQFSVVQTSVNVVDQLSLVQVLPMASEKGLGVLAKRALANAVWRFDEAPAADDLRTYWERWQLLRLDPEPTDWAELALRFTAYSAGVSCALVGSSSLAHLRSNIAAAERGPLPPEMVQSLHAFFDTQDRDWEGVV